MDRLSILEEIDRLTRELRSTLSESYTICAGCSRKHYDNKSEWEAVMALTAILTRTNRVKAMIEEGQISQTS